MIKMNCYPITRTKSGGGCNCINRISSDEYHRALVGKSEPPECLFFTREDRNFSYKLLTGSEEMYVSKKVIFVVAFFASGYFALTIAHIFVLRNHAKRAYGISHNT